MQSQAVSVLNAAHVPGVSYWNQYRSSTILAPLLGLTVCASSLGFLAFAAIEISGRNLPLVNRIILALGGLVMSLAPLLIGWFFWAQLRAAMRESNWVARLTHDGVYLNARSWLNWQLGAGDRTAVFIPYTAIEQVHEVRERLNVVWRPSGRLTHHAFVALKFKHKSDAALVDEVTREELRHVVSHPSFTRDARAWDDVPFFVHSNGDLWISCRDRFLLRALAKRVPRGDQQAISSCVGERMNPGDLEIARPALRHVLFHSRWSDAQQLAQFKLGLRYEDSLKYLESLLISSHPRSTQC